MLVRPVMKRLFFPWKTKEKKTRFARAPHDNKCVFIGYLDTLFSDLITVTCDFRFIARSDTMSNIQDYKTTIV